MKYLIIAFVLLVSCISNTSKKLPKTITEYEVQRDSVRIETSNGIIFGIMFKPIGIAKKTPAVLCLQGGGDVGLSNYLYEAEFFAKNGITALVCDKSGSGLSNTRKSWREQSFVDKTNEYYELFTWLSNQAYVDASKVGVHGMSEGGRLALNMAIEYPKDIAFVNAVSGPIESYKKNRLYAIKHHFLTRNIDSVTANKAVNLWDIYLEEVSLGKISTKTINKIKKPRASTPEDDYLPSGSTQLPQRPLSQDVHFTQENKLENIKCPVLFQYGELDILVNPKKSISLIPVSSNFKIINYKDTDHSMNLENGNIHPEFILDKKKWINSVLQL